MKLSIITINYNNAKGLEKTIASILPHLTQEVEYIVVDGQSIDGSVDIIEKYSDKIAYWVSEPDKGIFDAMNKGLSHAKGEYLLFMNSGDIVNEGTNIDTILGELGNEDIISYDIVVSNGEETKKFVHNAPDNPDFNHFIVQTIPHQSTFIKRQLLSEYGGYPLVKLAGDWIFFIDAICSIQCTYKHIHSSFSTYFDGGLSSLYENNKLLWDEKNEHIQAKYPLYFSFYQDWAKKRDELYKLKYSFSVKTLKKLGFLKWLKY